MLTDVLFGAVGEEDLVVAESECAEKPEGEFENATDFVFQLVGAAEDMGVVLGEASDAEQTVEYTRPFVSVDGAQLRQTHRQLPVAAERGSVHEDVEGAIHRLQVVVLLVDFHGGVHVFAVELQVAAGLPQLALSDMR